jgi:hypothetical protein
LVINAGVHLHPASHVLCTQVAIATQLRVSGSMLIRRGSRFHWIMYVFGAILIYSRRDPFIVYISNIFAILGLRAMYFLLPPHSPSTRIARANV